MAESNNASRDFKVFVGAYGHSESEAKPLVTVSDGVIGVENGKILFIDTKDNLNSLKKEHNFANHSIWKLKKSEFLIPGFVDVHIHAAQSMGSGLGLLGHEKELRETLKNFTVTSELNFKDPVLAKACYTDIVQSTLNCGTTTATYYASVDPGPCEILADVAEELGQRALIGKLNLNMSRPESDPKNDNSLSTTVLENTPEGLIMTEQFVRNILDRKNPLVKPIVSPKSAITCTEELLRGLADLAKKHDIHIQSQLSESEEENSLVLDLFPEYKTFTEIYQKTGLLTPKSIMAHCVHVTDEEIKILSEHSTSVAHCPTSNILHERGLCPVRKLKQAGIKVGLGTNVSSAFSTSMLQAMRHAILTSKIIRINNFETHPLLFDDALYLATLGGAEALSLQSETGNFEVGKSFDALRVNVSSIGSAMPKIKRTTLREKIQKFVMLGDQKNIIEVYVGGRKVNHSQKKKSWKIFSKVI